MGRLAQIEKRLKEIYEELKKPKLKMEDLDLIEKEIDSLKEERENIKNNVENRTDLMKDIAEGNKGTIIKRFGGNNMPDKLKDNIENEDIEVRAMQQYLINGTRNMTETEERALTLSGSSAVVPTNIYNKLITDSKYSDLLSKATVIKDIGPGKINIPIASNVNAEWKTENEDVTHNPNTTLDKLELSGHELMRLIQLSGASASMSAGNFGDLMLDLLSSEVIETLEKSFISGSGTGQPKGLDNLTYIANTNLIEATTTIKADDLAKAVSLLPQKYSRNAVILVNSDMFYQISQFKGTSEYAYNMETGATKFLGKEIIVSEHLENDTIYIVDPKELYVRFSMPLQIEADRSVGFKSGSIFLRALTVVDAAWNSKAVIKVGLSA